MGVSKNIDKSCRFGGKLTLLCHDLWYNITCILTNNMIGRRENGYKEKNIDGTTKYKRERGYEAEA